MTLPPRPNFLSDADRAKLDPNKRLTPQQKRVGLAMLADALQKQLSTNPTLQPLEARVETRPDGFTLIVDIPTPGPDQMVLPSSPDDAA